MIWLNIEIPISELLISIKILIIIKSLLDEWMTTMIRSTFKIPIIDCLIPNWILLKLDNKSLSSKHFNLGL